MTVFVALDYARLDINFYIVFLVVIVYIFLFGFAVGQNFVSPVKKLIQKAIEFKDGNLSSRLYMENKDEIGQLAVILNDLADKLEESRNTIKTTEKGVDIKVKARTEALEETITALEQKVKNRSFELERMINESKKMQEAMKDKELQMDQLKKEILTIKPKRASKKNA